MVSSNKTNQNLNETQKLNMKRLNKESLELLKSINSSVFTIKYEDSFYERIFSSENKYAFLFVDQDTIGTVSFSIDSCDVYIFTFGILPKYRNQGYGSKCWKELEFNLKNELDCKRIYLNVQTSNSRAIEFYLNKGFKIMSTISDYYIDTFPSSAYFMKKEINCDGIYLSG